MLVDRQKLSWARLAAAIATCTALSCGAGPKPQPAFEASAPAAEAATDDHSPAPEEPAPVARNIDDALGGRLYDRFYDAERFVPDRAATPQADGEGGPFGNGTLPNRAGQPLLNEGHDYRLKSLFGWDLRGQRGISGVEYQNKTGVAEHDLLDEKLEPAALSELLRNGTETLPAYKTILSEEEHESLMAFLLGVREGKLPHPDEIWTLSKGTPGNYRLVAGADAERGKRIFSERCTGCHGKQGTKMLLDDGEYSLGSHARQKGYEDWLKILNGQPHTKMKRLVRGESGRELAREVLDILAALCDREAFPAGAATRPDVPDGDPRCGDYLK